ncbi:unnamed protein product [marine sediment metagenome]|uniref:Uncharacterized protein n=1 Tax=marine sediment metagenome TaxID=412755 RepID=X1ADH6_9ZZZZ
MHVIYFYIYLNFFVLNFYLILFTVREPAVRKVIIIHFSEPNYRIIEYAIFELIVIVMETKPIDACMITIYKIAIYE